MKRFAHIAFIILALLAGTTANAQAAWIDRPLAALERLPLAGPGLSQKVEQTLREIWTRHQARERAQRARALRALQRPNSALARRKLQRLGYRSTNMSSAVIAFQKWEGLARDGVIGPQTANRLLTARRPLPARRPGSGREIQVDLARQVAIALQERKVVRILHISSGADSLTPPGDFKVTRKERMSWSVPFEAWLPWASYFNSGIAFHEYPSVPVWPASHGCVRVVAGDAKWLYDFASVGTRVRVY